MKTRTTPSMLIALLLASLTLGVTNAQADRVPLSHHRGQDSWPSVGITFGQTARVTTANTGEKEMSVVGCFSMTLAKSLDNLILLSSRVT